MPNPNMTSPDFLRYPVLYSNLLVSFPLTVCVCLDVGCMEWMHGWKVVP